MANTTRSKPRIRNTATEALNNPLISPLLGTMPAGAILGPGGAEAQEARGQRELVHAEQFPAKMGEHRETFEKMGFVFLGPTEGDPLFLDCQFPQGWTKRATSHAMTTEVLDAKGRVRATIFYKASFYDRRADATPVWRFRVIGRGFDDHKRWVGYVIDNVASTTDGDGKETYHVIHVTEPLVSETVRWEDEDAANAACAAWLDAHLPDWQSPLGHWDDPTLPAVGEFPSWETR